MKILIIGPLGAGKSSLAYAINKKFDLPRLNLDEICRYGNGCYYSYEESFTMMDEFLAKHSSWVAEGCQRHLFERLQPDLIVDMRINRLVAIWRFTTRFIKAKKLIGNEIDKNLPVQAYHYRKIAIAKIREYDAINQEINAAVGDFLKNKTTPTLKCKSFKDYKEIFYQIRKLL